jgi:penicillin amidase
MDLRRHIAAGRLAELVGEPTAWPSDKVVRTLGWRRVAEAELLDAHGRAPGHALEAYADGVNDFWIAQSGDPAEMALEYTDARHSSTRTTGRSSGARSTRWPG